MYRSYHLCIFLDQIVVDKTTVTLVSFALYYKLVPFREHLIVGCPIIIPGPVTTKNMQTPLPHLRSGHLDIKYAQWAANKDGRNISYHIIARLGATSVQKERYGQSEIQLSPKEGYIFRVDWNWPDGHCLLKSFFFVWFLVFQI